MFEYLKYGALVLLVFMSLVLWAVEKNSKEKSIFIQIIIWMMIGGLFYIANKEYSTATKNIYDFKHEEAVLKCISGGGVYNSADTYRVSLKDGWYAEKDYFIKESLAIRANKCERW